MKPLYLFIYMLCCIHSYSQDWVQHLEFRTGYSQSTQSPDWYRPDQVGAWRNNIHAAYFGCNFNTLFNEKWGVSSGLQLCQKGLVVDYHQYGPVIGNETDYIYHLSYLELPVSFIFNMKKWQFFSGIQASYLLNSSWKFRQRQFYYTNLYVVTYLHVFTGTDMYNPFDFGINLGASRKINDYLSIEFTFLRGLTIPDKYSEGDIHYQESFLFGIKYYFLKNSRYPVGKG